MKKVSFAPKSVVLNYETKKMEFRGILKNEGSEKPKKVWLWAYFFSPLSEVEGSWSDRPIVLDDYFKDSNETDISVSHHFHWWDNPNTPKSEWYCRINVSDISEDDAIIDSENRNKSIDGAIKVTVLEELSSGSGVANGDVTTKPMPPVFQVLKPEIETRISGLIKNKIKVKDPYKLKGTTLNHKYLLEDYLGGGGMGAVYLATQKDSDNIFAIKILKPDIAARSPEYAQLFEQEVAAAKELSHPNIVKIFDSGADDDISFMVMELLDGQTLEDEINNGNYEIEFVKNTFRQICNAFIVAHNQNIIHLDIKPANIFILSTPQDANFVKIIDFGLAKILKSESGTTITRFKGGTDKYCSPEHFGGKLTNRSDIYSLGATLYNMLTGVIPFGNSYTYAKMHPNMELPPIPFISAQRSELPKDLDFVIQKALRRNPFDRQESVEQLLDEFEQALSGTFIENTSDESIKETANLLSQNNISSIFYNSDSFSLDQFADSYLKILCGLSEVIFSSNFKDIEIKIPASEFAKIVVDAIDLGGEDYSVLLVKELSYGTFEGQNLNIQSQLSHYHVLINFEFQTPAQRTKFVNYGRSRRESKILSSAPNPFGFTEITKYDGGLGLKIYIDEKLCVKKGRKRKTTQNAKKSSPKEEPPEDTGGLSR
jgi:serine/threonine protein kinase